MLRTVFCMLALSTSGIAAESKPTSAVARLFAAEGTRGAKLSQSILVTRLSDGASLYEKNPDQLVSPASVTKVLTSAAVLARFSPVHTFKTPLYYTGARNNERVQGDLVVVGDGDPFIVSEKLWQLAADIRNLGIREFSGDLVIDNSLFDGESRDQGRQAGAKSTRNAYDAPVSAFGVNFNTFAVAVAPSDEVGRPAYVSLDPYPLRGVTIDNNVRTSKVNAARALEIRRVGGSKDEQLTATGTIARGSAMYKVYRSVGDHVAASGEYVKAFLKSEGVIVRGGVRQGRKPEAATLLLTMDSYEMRRIVAGLNTFSNNYIADVLVKRLGAAFPLTGSPDASGQGTYANGLAVITDFLRKDVGIKSEFVLQNGSGLDTDNRVTARQINDVLAYVEKRMDIFPEFLASLPATGWDGTLKKRFGKGDTEELRGQVRAKSGTLSDPVAVAGLAGYFRHPKHGLVAFTILENGQPGNGQPAIGDLRQRQDQALVAFMNDL